MELETIKIEDPKGKREFVIINKKDFNPEIHFVFGTRPAPEPEPVEVPMTPEPESIRKSGRKTK